MEPQTPDEEPESPLLTPPDSPSPLSPDSEIEFRSASSPPTARSPPPLRTTSDMTSTSSVSNMNPSSTPLGTLNAARGKPPPAASTLSARNPDIMARMKAFSSSRQGQPAVPGRQNSVGPTASSAPSPASGFPSGFKLPPQLQRPAPGHAASSPAITGGAVTGGARGPPPAKGLSLAEKRGLKLPGGLPGSIPASPPPAAGGKKKPGLKLSQMNAGQGPSDGDAQQNGDDAGDQAGERSKLNDFAQYLDPATGNLRFAGKATLSNTGIEFASGRSFHISLDEVDTLDELGKGNYGTVYKVRHARPKFRQVGAGLAGNKSWGAGSGEEDAPMSPTNRGGTTGVVMAMKEMRLELEDAKFQTIIMELDVLHRCISPYIVDFYGAFFQEGAVYICMEWMDGGSVDRLYGDGVPEGVLRKITLNTVLGLKSLKEEHNIIHRDVKPTNILVNTRGQVKICDFGVSGNLVASIAKTNIGCQSYMAPERISSGGVAQAGGMAAGTYSVQSDIWSLGLTIIECAMGRYPYPPETYDNIFSQLSAIVDGDPPDLPSTFSPTAREFVAGCLNKIPKLRPTYPMLLLHSWLAPLAKPHTIMEEDEEAAEAEAAEGPDAVDALAQGTAKLDVAEEGRLTSPEVQEKGFVDREVGEWVLDALDRRKRGVLGQGPKPALHAAPLDATSVGSPLEGKGHPNQGAVAVDA